MVHVSYGCVISSPEEANVRMCKRSSGRPCSRFPAPIAVGSGWWCPILPSARASTSQMPIKPYLESKMLQKVSGAAGLVCFCPRSSVNPHAHGRRLRPWRVLGGDLSTISSCIYHLPLPLLSILTVSPLDNVVDSVLTPFLTTGLAYPRFNAETVLLRGARLRSPLVRLRANRRDAMEKVVRAEERLLTMEWP